MNETKKQGMSLPTVGEDPENKIKDVRVFALDMDGTIYLGDRWIDGAKDFLHAIAETGREYFFLTNNSSKSPKAYEEKLRRMGFKTTLDHIITSGQATIWYIKKHFPGKRVFLLGNDLLRTEFSEAGVLLEEAGTVAEQKKAELVVTGFDTTLDYEKMCRVCDLVREGLPYVATHPDLNCPTETGFIPDIGAISAFIKASTGREPDVIVGKPYAPMAAYLLERARRLAGHASDCSPDSNEKDLHTIEYNKIAMVGDRLYTDVACGVNAGMTGILVLSGEATMEDAIHSDVMPDLIYHSVKDICLK